MASEFAAPAAGATTLTTAGDLYLGNPATNQWDLSRAQASVNPTPNLNGSIAERMNYPFFGYGPKVYENLYDLVESGDVYEAAGTWANDTTYNPLVGGSLWNNAYILDIGRENNPAVRSTGIRVPAGYDMLWVRILNESPRNIWLETYFDAGDALGAPPATRTTWYREYGGANHPIRWGPYGGHQEQRRDNVHLWVPMNLNSNAGGTAYLIARAHSQNTPDSWISGIAFTQNPWGYSAMSGLSWHRWNTDGTVDADWHGSFNGEYLVKRDTSGTSAPIEVTHPIVDNGVDKVLNIIVTADNSSRVGCPISVNGVNLDPRTSMIETLEPVKWNLVTKLGSVGVNSYVIPAAVIAAGTTAGYMDIEVRTNQSKNNTYYIAGSYCCDLNA